jgi:hypothetical protein
MQTDRAVSGEELMSDNALFGEVMQSYIVLSGEVIGLIWHCQVC